MRRPARLILATVLAALGSVVTIATTPTRPAIAAPSHVAPGRIFVITDSVLLGGAKQIEARFADWSDANVVGFPGIPVELGIELASNNRDKIDDTVVVGLGYNYPVGETAKFDRSIDFLMTTMLSWGVKHVVWVNLRDIKAEEVGSLSWEQIKPMVPFFTQANAQLATATKRWPQLTIADWAAVAHTRGLTYDAIHLTPAGAAKVADVIRDAVDGIGRLKSGTVTELAIAPPTAVTSAAATPRAAAINLTVFAPERETYVTVYPCGRPRPTTSSINVRPGQTVANLVVSEIGEGGKVCVFTPDDTHVVADLFGVFTGDAFSSAGPLRLTDTRPTKRVMPGVPLHVALPTDATGAVFLNVTANTSDRNAFVTAYPCGQTAPTTSTVNVAATETAAAFTAITVDPTHELCITVSSPLHVIVDLTGQLAVGFDATGGPTRVLDTRSQRTAVSGLHVVPPTASNAAIRLLTVTADRGDAGYLTVTRCTAPALSVSNLNTRRHVAVANAAFASTTDTCAFTDKASNVIVDEVGRLSPEAGFTPILPTRILDTRTKGVYQGL